MTLFAWPYPGRDRLPAALIARLTAAGLLPRSDTPGRRSHHGHGPTVLAGDSESGPILTGAPAHHGSAHDALTAGLAAAGLHVYAGGRPAGGYCAVWDYHPAGEATTPLRHRCCQRHPPSGGELDRDRDDETECQLNRWARLMLGSPASVPAMVLLGGR